jgi:Tol biopolymer transport system component
MSTFCTACAAANPRTLERCRNCGAPLDGVRTVGRRARGRGWAKRLNLLLAILLPLTMGAAAGGYLRADRTAKAAAYERGVIAFALGDPEAAIVAFADAGGYRDAPARHAVLQASLAPYRALYVAGVAAVSSGDPDGAVAALLPVVRAFPNYRDANVMLAQARAQQRAALETAFAAARDRGDWLAAERALAALVALDPGDEARAAELSRFRREHAPVVFTRDEALYLASPNNADGWKLPVDLPAAWPVWSPDRSRIAFVSPGDDGQLALYVVGVDGTGLTRLGERLRPYEAPVWSPDGTRIAFLSTAALDGLDLIIDPAVAAISASVPGASRAIPLREPALRVVEVATGRIVDPTGGGATSVMSPTWSPSGDRLAFVSRTADELDQRYDDVPGGELGVVDLATGALSRPDSGRISFPWRVAWSPSREALLVWTRAPGQAYDADRVPLYLLDMIAGSSTDLNPARARVTMAVWSPDGASFAYLEHGDRVRVRSLAGQDRTVLLAEQGSEFLSWSPDGAALLVAGGGRPSQIVALSGNGSGRSTAFPLNYDTTRRLAGPPRWAPLNPVPDPRPPSVGGTAWDAAR